MPEIEERAAPRDWAALEMQNATFDSRQEAAYSSAG